MLRFVVLHHEMPPEADRPSHWDLMLEQRTTLAAWALDNVPTAGVSVSAERLADHRRAYLDYEGPVSKNRGTVAQWDTGTYEVEISGPRLWRVKLAGTKLIGRVTLQADERVIGHWFVDFESC